MSERVRVGGKLRLIYMARPSPNASRRACIIASLVVGGGVQIQAQQTRVLRAHILTTQR